MFKKAPRLYLYPYHQYSMSAKAVATGVGARRIKTENSAFIASPNKTIINWGCSHLPEHVIGCRILNRADDVLVASNKALFLERMKQAGVRVPEFTRAPATALEWYNAGRHLFARMVLQGSGGEGIVDLRDVGELELEDCLKAPLFVEYVPKKEEYRVHVFNGQVIDVQQKKLRTHDENNVRVNPEEVNWKIRNHANGFVFARNDIAPSDDVIAVGRAAVVSLGLLWGAADVVWNEQRAKAYVLEVNTAPGLEGQTTTSYVNAFKEYLR